MPRKGFTMIELLLVIAVIAVFAVTVVVLINPSELYKQGRDSSRLNGLGALNAALSTFQGAQPAGALGTANVLYISVPDPTATSSAGDQCQGLGMPALPSGWTYDCASPSYYKNMDGTGWVPVNLASVPAAAVLGALPVDPANATSSGFYYTYVTDGSNNWEIAGLPESAKQRAALDSHPMLTTYPGVIAFGSNLNLSPLYNTSGLAGYWNLDDGAGTTAEDLSGNSNNGTTQNNPTWATGKVNGALTLNGSTQYVSVPDASSLDIGGTWTAAGWVYLAGLPASGSKGKLLEKISTASAYTNYAIGVDNASACSGLGWRTVFQDSSGVTYQTCYVTPVNTGTWYHIAGVWDSAYLNLYVNGTLVATSSFAGHTPSSASSADGLGLGANPHSPIAHYINGTIDDIRVYNRALSASEVLALYNAQK